MKEKRVAYDMNSLKHKQLSGILLLYNKVCSFKITKQKQLK